ncbi:MAG TPA: sialidase family protein [Candidatus Thermoplasmatota archaeon]|nr:sialidase family protein [Candidatus Thermoplasmatota archaeon]
MRPGAPTLLLILLFAGCAAPAADEPAPGPAVVERVLVDAGAPGGEPMLALAPDGTLYLQAVSSRPNGAPESAAWRSDDGGATWHALPIPEGAAGSSYDGAVAVGPEGEVYLANAENARLRIWRSVDSGGTWEELAVPAVAPAHRMWLVPSAGRLDVGVDTLGGPNFHFALDARALTPVAPNYDVGGSLARRDDGLMLWPRHEAAPFDRFVAYRSRDDGGTWTSAAMTPAAPPETFPLGEARRTSIWTPMVFGADGTAYHARSEMGALLLSRSLDDGLTWSPEVALTREDEFAVLPWMSPALDVVAVVRNGTAWEPLALRVEWPREAHAPALLRATLPGALHEGPLCTFGQACDPAERPLGDYSAVLTLPTGDVVAAFGSSKDAPAYRSAPVVYRIPGAAFM